MNLRARNARIRCSVGSNPNNASRYVLAALRLALGVLFLVSAIPKVQRPYFFLDAVYAYGIVNEQVGLMVAAVLPWFEMAIALCLLFNLLPLGALATSSALLLGFVCVQTSVLLRDMTVACGCFSLDASSMEAPISTATVVRTAAIAALSFGLLLVSWKPWRRVAVDHTPAGRRLTAE